MASNALIVANDNVFNKTVLGADAFYFSTPADIAAIINKPIEKQAYNYFIENNLKKIRDKYTWQGIVDAYEKVFLDLVKK